MRAPAVEMLTRGEPVTKTFRWTVPEAGSHVPLPGYGRALAVFVAGAGIHRDADAAAQVVVAITAPKIVVADAAIEPVAARFTVELVIAGPSTNPVAAPFAGNAVLEHDVHPGRGIGLKTSPQGLENIRHRWAARFSGAVIITCLGCESRHDIADLLVEEFPRRFPVGRDRVEEGQHGYPSLPRLLR